MKNKSFLIAVVAIAAVVFGVMIFWSKSSDDKSSAVKVDAALLIKAHSPVKGPSEAPVTIVEFLDPECEACRAMHPILKTLMGEFDGKVKLVIRYLPFHGNSKLAAAYLEEAREQGKFDAALDLFFEKQPEWGSHAHPRPELLPGLMEQIGISKASMDEEALMSKHGWKVDIDHQDGIKLGVRMTPTFFVNGEMLNNIGYSPIREAIEKALARNH